MRCEAITAYSAAREALQGCFAQCSCRFVDLFSGSAHPLRAYSCDAAALCEAGILEVSGGEARSTYPMVAFDGLFLRCDAPSTPLIDRVFPLQDDESLLLATWAEAGKGESVLEIGTGAGAAALRLAAAGAGKVLATDVNPRVREFLTFNAELNGLAGRVEYVNCDVFSGLEGERFDVIVSNPPFVPVPSEAGYFTHSDGGPLGTAVLERIATDWTEHLRPGGRLYGVALSLGSSLGFRICDLFPNASVCPIYEPPFIGSDRLLTMFDWAEGFDRWRGVLTEAGYDRVGYFGIGGGSNGRERLARLRQSVPEQRLRGSMTPWSECSWGMEARLRRYRTRPRSR